MRDRSSGSLGDPRRTPPLAKAGVRRRNGWTLALAAIGLVSGGAAHALTRQEIEAQVLSAMDTAAEPCGDFYQYACGRWVENTAIPADETRVVRGPSAAADSIRARIAVLLREAAANPGVNRDLALAGTYFAACMDLAGRDDGRPNPAAVAALQPYFDLIDSVDNTQDFLNAAGRLAAIGVPAVFRLSLLADVFSFPGPGTYIFRLDPADPGFYDGDIYRKSDAGNRALRGDLRNIIKTILARFGDTAAADRHARDIIKLEALFSKYHPYFGKQPGIVLVEPHYLYAASARQDWNRYFEGAGVPEGKLLFFNRYFIGALGNTLTKFPKDSLRSYLRWTLIRSYRFHLPHYYREFPALSPQFAALTSAGFSPPWKQCVDNTASVLPETTGKIWSEGQTSDRLLQVTAAMMESVRGEFLVRLPGVSWLDGSSAAATANKARNTDLQFGIPGTWTDETAIPVSAGGALGNTLAANEFNFRRMAARIGQPVSRTIWDSDLARQYPHTVNAGYLRPTNQIYVPLGIQQEPFAHPDYPPAMNFGGLGAVLGHEFTHGYDDGGHYFDAEGRYRNIWTARTTRAFDARTRCLVRQYGRYRISPPPVRLDGGAMLTENIADNGGVGLAFGAFRANSPAPSAGASGIGGLTEDQLFFVAYAQNWCEKTTPARAAYLASRSWYNYAPNRYRVTGPLSNSAEFAAAFGCPAGSAMNPPRKCEVW